ncbi:hypothetical protein CEXT_463041 [Caerostris extrusa]|uniref:Uncharacterized protein n=1 Tax=Caerostris extrusa TaxID=172846 RepID=A0AAV4T6G0_CAEEX|nr:hypothetical protein CEXT_463041 [Caerostris extrusa]
MSRNAAASGCEFRTGFGDSNFISGCGAGHAKKNRRRKLSISGGEGRCFRFCGSPSSKPGREKLRRKILEKVLGFFNGLRIA